MFSKGLALFCAHPKPTLKPCGFTGPISMRTCIAPDRFLQIIHIFIQTPLLVFPDLPWFWLLLSLACW